jgi:hypothetical protein
MDQKKCICCGLEQGKDKYYKHSGMIDGLLNKCKDCCKKQARDRYSVLSQSDDWLEKEKLRSKEKYHRLNYKNKQLENNKKYEWKQSCEYKGLRKWWESRHGKVLSNIELHHWSYDQKYLRDIILMKKKEHRRLHQLLKLDLNNKIFLVKETNESLDTKQKHIDFIIKSNFKICNF